MKLVLIGLRGTGKSTVGRLMAERLKWQFFDSDVILQERAGMTIREIFEKQGEAHFRKLESAVVQEISTKDGAVIASGGGAVLDPNNVAAMKKNGFVVHLSASPSVLWKRIAHDQSSPESRPRLVHNASSGLDELKKVMLSRAAVYAESRDVEVIVEDRSPDEVAEAIMLLMHTHGAIK
jgi:shikimate kinase